jgi:hypothetical protein
MITYDTLRTAGACQEQRELFRQLFPKGTEVTEELCVRHAQDFDWEWAAENLLDDATRKVYNDAEAPAWKAYEDAVGAALKAYDDTAASAWKVYDDTRASALRAYTNTAASAFAKAWLSQEGRTR